MEKLSNMNIILTQYSVGECIYLYNILITDVRSTRHPAQRRAEKSLECESEIKRYKLSLNE
jgi:hypothetical protein